MCTSSRSIMMTGLQTADNGMSENLDVPWVKDLSPNIPTIGHMLRKSGYKGSGT
jgi:arylsulfatase A-like enzyme